MSEKVKDRVAGAMNVNYFVEDERIAPNNNVAFQRDEILVFDGKVKGAYNGGAVY